MDFAEVLRRRRMVRTYDPRPVADDVLARVLGAGLRSPAAGNTDALDLVVLQGADETARYWDASLPAERRAGFRWPGLLHAPVLVVPTVRPGAYVDRYGEHDKAATGLGEGTDRWSVPYWHVDGGMAVMALLLAAVDEGLGALFFGQFAREPAVRVALGIPDDVAVLGTVALGHPAPGDEPGRSAGRARRPLDEVVHRGGW